MTNYTAAERPNGMFEVVPRARLDGRRSEYERREDAQRRADYLNWATTVQPAYSAGSR